MDNRNAGIMFSILDILVNSLKDGLMKAQHLACIHGTDPDGSGTAPVRITNSQHRLLAGWSNSKISGAAIAFGNVLRGTLVQTDWIRCCIRRMEKPQLPTMEQK